MLARPVKEFSLAPAFFRCLAILTLAGSWVFGCTQVSAPAVFESTRDQAPKVPVVFVPGVTGVELRHRVTGKTVWGKGGNLLGPHHRGYATARPVTDGAVGTRLEPGAVILKIRLLGIFRGTIYQQLVDLFEANGYRWGDLETPKPD
jgi:hypothetical protein